MKANRLMGVWSKMSYFSSHLSAAGMWQTSSVTLRLVLLPVLADALADEPCFPRNERISAGCSSSSWSFFLRSRLSVPVMCSEDCFTAEIRAGLRPRGIRLDISEITWPATVQSMSELCAFVHLGLLNVFLVHFKELKSFIAGTMIFSVPQAKGEEVKDAVALIREWEVSLKMLWSRDLLKFLAALQY